MFGFLILIGATLKSAATLKIGSSSAFGLDVFATD
jgi:hypothetical protein